MSGLATLRRVDRTGSGSSTDPLDRSWLIAESLVPNDTLQPFATPQLSEVSLVLEALLGTEGQSQDMLDHNHATATVVCNVGSSDSVAYGSVDASWHDSVFTTLRAYGPSDDLSQVSVSVFFAEASSEGSLAQVAPVVPGLSFARLDELRALGEGYVFHDGMFSPFSRGLLGAIDEIGVGAFGAIAGVLQGDRWPPSIIGEAMRWIGDIDDPETLQRRIDLLALALQHESYLVREGAVLGLMYAESEQALEPLSGALEAETHPLVKLSIEEALVDLGVTSGG